MAVTQPKKPVVRRFGRLIVRLDAGGLSIRGFRKKRWRRVSWNEVAWLMSGDVNESLRQWSEREGEALLEAIGAK